MDMPRIPAAVTGFALAVFGCQAAPPLPTAPLAELLPKTTLDGKPFDPQSVAGQPLVISYFRPTCGHCQVELPRLARVAEERGATMVTVMVAGDANDGELLLRRSGVVGPALSAVGADGQAARASAGIRAVPYTLIVDSNGRVQRGLLGEQREVDLRAAMALLR